ncbi:hypothetical protein NXX36_18505 [Bacteroides fragilis]|nr:hypothetical protein [Bacteroides fragilis]MCS2537994.1 hypothetical protein [Bacteroides fragilis]MCS2780446.1 hypothetical protein [Bacteroides fragilis]MCS3147847.1 hypothetical protein [Bacteroides fragilis]MCY6335029.1 hypothetical protein [Bacteroides fragilis]MCZ2694381.1 hypothetical protein [Bacteroides fragilis]
MRTDISSSSPPLVEGDCWALNVTLTEVSPSIISRWLVQALPSTSVPKSNCPM